MVFNEPCHNGVNLCTIVQESHATLPINPYPGYIFDPIPSLKGLGFKKGVCVWHLTPWPPHIGAPLAWSPFLEGPRLPSLVLSHLSGLNVSPF